MYEAWSKLVGDCIDVNRKFIDCLEYIYDNYPVGNLTLIQIMNNSPNHNIAFAVSTLKGIDNNFIALLKKRNSEYCDALNSYKNESDLAKIKVLGYIVGRDNCVLSLRLETLLHALGIEKEDYPAVYTEIVQDSKECLKQLSILVYEQAVTQNPEPKEEDSDDPVIPDWLNNLDNPDYQMFAATSIDYTAKTSE